MVEEDNVTWHFLLVCQPFSHETALALKFWKKQEEIINPIIPDERDADTRVDTVKVIESVVDTLVIQTIDTVYIHPEAVKKFYVANGIDAAGIKISYFGETRPMADYLTEEGQRKNRRVEMTILEKK